MTCLEISRRILERIDDDPDDPSSATEAEVIAAIQEGQELMALLTLCLETTATLTLAASTPFASMRGTFPNFLVPLRMQIGGVRVRPATLADLDSLNDAWQSTAGTPTRYGTAGFNFFWVTPQPTVSTDADLTYAKSPAPMVQDDFPEVPVAYHMSLVRYGVYKVRLKEGAQGLERGVVELNRFLDDCQQLGDFVRAKSQAARYDVLPFELKLYDRSRLIAKVKEKAWQRNTPPQ